jgi:WhiB family redox-sensing transcriptional regulator
VVAVEIEALMQPWADVPDAHDLLRLLLHRPEWQADAACRGRRPAKWFPTRGEDLEPARAVCRSCPVRVECAEYALALTDDGGGVWAGTSSRPGLTLPNRRTCVDATKCPSSGRRKSGVPSPSDSLGGAGPLPDRMGWTRCATSLLEDDVVTRCFCLVALGTLDVPRAVEL